MHAALKNVKLKSLEEVVNKAIRINAYKNSISIQHDIIPSLDGVLGGDSLKDRFI